MSFTVPNAPKHVAYLFPTILQTLKNKRRQQNKFGVAVLFPRFTTEKITFAQNFLQMGSDMFSSTDRFPSIFNHLV